MSYFERIITLKLRIWWKTWHKYYFSEKLFFRDALTFLPQLTQRLLCLLRVHSEKWQSHIWTLRIKYLHQRHRLDPDSNKDVGVCRTPRRVGCSTPSLLLPQGHTGCNNQNIAQKNTEISQRKSLNITWSHSLKATAGNGMFLSVILLRNKRKTIYDELLKHFLWSLPHTLYWQAGRLVTDRYASQSFDLVQMKLFVFIPVLWGPQTTHFSFFLRRLYLLMAFRTWRGFELMRKSVSDTNYQPYL